jgi:pantoate--beta-alanine ligase
MSVAVIRDLDALRRQTAAWRKADETIALVPTMGALHEGHLDLVRLAKSQCTHAVVSIFVNPAQFAPHEDFDRYPRDEAGDLAKLKRVGCDLVWSPERSLMYPDDFATRIVPAGAAEGLESDFRPHFFGGVATVCCKLFTQVGPHIAVFGEKDYQQLAVVRQMVRDLNLPLQIVGLPTVREPDVAPTIHRVITQVAEAAASGDVIAAAVAGGKTELEAAGFKVDYLEVRDAVTLAPLTTDPDGPLRVLVAAWLGKTRLIDNIGIPHPLHRGL